MPTGGAGPEGRPYRGRRPRPQQHGARALRIGDEPAVAGVTRDQGRAQVGRTQGGDVAQRPVTTGPLIDAAAIEKVEAHLGDAVGKGGKIVLGGHPMSGQFFEPTVLLGATQQMLIAREETFGPVAPLFKFDTVDEGVAAFGG